MDERNSNNQNELELQNQDNDQQATPSVDQEISVVTGKPIHREIDYRKTAICWAIFPIALIVLEALCFVSTQVFGSGAGDIRDIPAAILFWLFIFPPCWLIHIFAIICLFVSAHYNKQANETNRANNTNGAVSETGEGTLVRGLILFIIGVIIILPFILIAYAILQYGRRL